MQRQDSLEELAQYLNSPQIRKYYDCKRVCDLIKSQGRQKQLVVMRERTLALHGNRLGRTHDLSNYDRTDHRDDTPQSRINGGASSTVFFPAREPSYRAQNRNAQRGDQRGDQQGNQRGEPQYTASIDGGQMNIHGVFFNPRTSPANRNNMRTNHLNNVVNENIADMSTTVHSLFDNITRQRTAQRGQGQRLQRDYTGHSDEEHTYEGPRQHNEGPRQRNQGRVNNPGDAQVRTFEFETMAEGDQDAVTEAIHDVLNRVTAFGGMPTVSIMPLGAVGEDSHSRINGNVIQFFDKLALKQPMESEGIPEEDKHMCPICHSKTEDTMVINTPCCKRIVHHHCVRENIIQNITSSVKCFNCRVEECGMKDITYEVPMSESSDATGSQRTTIVCKAQRFSSYGERLRDAMIAKARRLNT